MNTHLLKLVVILAAVLFMLSLAGAARAQGETSSLPAERGAQQQTCTDWNLASDFRRWPNQENPNRDSCGNLGVWHLMESNGLNPDPATYTLLPYYANRSGGIQGIEKWTGTGSGWMLPPDGVPENRTQHHRGAPAGRIHIPTRRRCRPSRSTAARRCRVAESGHRQRQNQRIGGGSQRRLRRRHPLVYRQGERRACLRFDSQRGAPRLRRRRRWHEPD